MVTKRSKQPLLSVAPPPRTLNVKKFAESRASELESLHSIIADRLKNNFQSRRNKRRRTTGYDDRIGKNRHRKRQNLEQTTEGDASASKKDKKKVPRRIRRKIELGKNPETGYCTSGDGTKRLRTHLWHAKRFVMTKLWGFHLPLGLQGGGRGSRALLKRFKYGALVHDASYCCAVQLEGPDVSLSHILRMVLVPTPSAHLEDLPHSLLSGISYGIAMLHHVGAPVSQLIAPVTYMWRPFHRQNTSTDAEKDHSVDGHTESRNPVLRSFRQLWVWIHASAFSEGYDALKLACKKQMDETGISINCFSLEGKLAKLEVMGSKANEILKKVLCPVLRMPLNSCQLKKCSDAVSDLQLEKSYMLRHMNHCPSHAILSLTVHDPRDLPAKKVKSDGTEPSTGLHGDVLEDKAEEHDSSIGSADNHNEFLPSLWLKLGGNSVFPSDSKGLWESHNALTPPVEENLICMEKHKQRLALFCLNDTSSGMLAAETNNSSSKSCPILLLKNNQRRWSIILPLSWVKAFWIQIILQGAHAIGLRERHWVACDERLPYFPFDFPDCKAYSCLMAAEAAAADQHAELRPPDKRPLKIPIPPPWDSVKISLEKGPARVGISHLDNEKICGGEVALCDSLTDASCGSNSKLLDESESPFEGFVARESNMLREFLSEIDGAHWPLFPSVKSGKDNLYKLMKDETKCSWDQTRAYDVPVNRKLCFVRVLLDAYKKGTFKEGAIVCAPSPVDLSLWTSRSDESNEVFQIPNSSLMSYFNKQTLGKWRLQIPDDPVGKESHRWPIGFVTTGFVRGSKKPVALALCEATLLAWLRLEHWNETSKRRRKRRMLYVLVRNLNSTAYRLANATVVLEQQEEDMGFM